jgi:lipopolysaccharide/colanic/teichoic acid biosynthesis glycosyltransferase
MIVARTTARTDFTNARRASTQTALGRSAKMRRANSSRAKQSSSPEAFVLESAFPGIIGDGVVAPHPTLASADRPTDLQLVVRESPQPPSETALRILNVVVAAVALVIVWPVLVVVGLLIKLTSPGPAFYSQTRVGVDRREGRDRRNEGRRVDGRRTQDLGGQLFRIHKLRTMTVDAERDGRAVWAQPNDPRTTWIGRFLRKTRIDELPQLYNVLRGDMNIVGPRPERPSIFAELRQCVPCYQLRQKVRPGITGWAQVNQAYDTSLDDVRTKVQLDLEYVRMRSLLADIRIMTKTIPVMLFRLGGW